MEQNCCPCCGQSMAQSICRLGPVPVMVNQLCRTLEEARAVPKAEITLAQCKSCGVVWNRAYQPEKLVYNAQYENSQDLGKAYQAHFADILSFLNTHISLKGKRVLEIGCGKGRFLKELAKETGCQAYGVDPSYLGNTESSGCHFYKEEFNESFARNLGKASFDCILLRQVFDQVAINDSPLGSGFLEFVSSCLREDGYLYIEGLDFRYLQQNQSLLDLSYERYTYFSAETLERIMYQAGIMPVAKTSSFQGQYMAVIGRKSNAFSRIPFVGAELSWKADQAIQLGRRKLAQLAEKGRVAVWGAANRGVMFCNLLDDDCTLIDCMIDILPRKQGGFLPGTGHSILSPESIAARNIRYMVVANSNYQSEIISHLQGLGSTAAVLPAEQFFIADL